nr:hypothetical protein [Tanacetum cinerariifolium]
MFGYLHGYLIAGLDYFRDPDNSRHKTTKPDDLSERAKKGIAGKGVSRVDPVGVGSILVEAKKHTSTRIYLEPGLLSFALGQIGSGQFGFREADGYGGVAPTRLP